jgi:hypothetical protein
MLWKQSRNKIQQTGKTSEKNQRHNGAVAIRRAVAANRSGLWKPAMRAISVALMGMLVATSFAIAAPVQSHTKVSLTRNELCSRLSRQVDEAIETHAKAVQAAEAKALQKKAVRYCAERKQAQGIRMFANALKLLGVTPVDPDR